MSAREEDPAAAAQQNIPLSGYGEFGEPPPLPVPRFGHGSRVPGWDESVDLEKDPAEVPEPGSVEVPDELRAEIEAHMADYPDRHSAALPALTAAQRMYGWCSPEAIEQVACVMAVTPGYLDSVVTFYDMLEQAPVPPHSVYVCTNISCSLLGADALLDTLLKAAGEEFNVRAFECLGACDIAPMASVDGVYVGPLALHDVPTLLEDVRAGREVLPDKQLVRRPVADPRANSKDFSDRPAGAAGGVRAAASGGSPRGEGAGGPRSDLEERAAASGGSPRGEGAGDLHDEEGER